MDSELLSNQNEAFRNCINTFQNLTINELQDVSKVITELISTYKKTEKLLKKANVLLNDEVDNSFAEFMGEKVKVEKKKIVKKDCCWMAPKRLLPKGMTDKDDDKFIKDQKDRGQEARGLSLRGLNDKPLRFKVNKNTCEVVKVNATNYTTEGNIRFKEMFPNGVDEERKKRNTKKWERKKKTIKKRS